MHYRRRCCLFGRSRRLVLGLLSVIWHLEQSCVGICTSDFPQDERSTPAGSNPLRHSLRFVDTSGLHEVEQLLVWRTIADTLILQAT